MPKLTTFNGQTIRRLIRGAFIAVPLGLLAHLVYVILATQPELLDSVARIKPGWLIAAGVMVLIPHLAHAARIFVWSRVFGNPLRPGQALRAVAINELGGAVTPTAFGGGYAKLYYLYKCGLSPGRATLMMVVGSVEDLVFVLGVVPATIILTKAWTNPHIADVGQQLLARWPIALAIALGVILLAVGVRWVLTRRKTNEIPTETTDRPKSLKERWHAYRHDLAAAISFAWKNGKGAFAFGSFCAALGWGMRYASVNALILGLGLATDWPLYSLLHWLIFGSMTLIPTPGAVGGAEVVFYVVFGAVLPIAVMPVLTSIWRFLTFYLALMLGAVGLALAGPGVDLTSSNDTEADTTSSVDNTQTEPSDALPLKSRS